MTIDEFDRLDLHDKLTVLYETVVLVLMPLIGDPTEED